MTDWERRWPAGTLERVCVPEELLRGMARRVSRCQGHSTDFRAIREQLDPASYVGPEIVLQLLDSGSSRGTSRVGRPGASNSTDTWPQALPTALSAPANGYDNDVLRAAQDLLFVWASRTTGQCLISWTCACRLGGASEDRSPHTRRAADSAMARYCD